eukprot:1138770-Pelagomonas_calceolata.AAC.10
MNKACVACDASSTCHVWKQCNVQLDFMSFWEAASQSARACCRSSHAGLHMREQCAACAMFT